MGAKVRLTPTIAAQVAAKKKENRALADAAQSAKDRAEAAVRRATDAEAALSRVRDELAREQQRATHADADAVAARRALDEHVNERKLLLEYIEVRACEGALAPSPNFLSGKSLKLCLG